MPRINVDSEAFSDWRFEKLGHSIGMDSFSAFGRTIHVWHYCLSQLRDTLTADEIDGVSRQQHFALAMMSASLAEKNGDQFRIKGMSERMEWLKVKKEASRRGGAANKKRLESLVPIQTDSHQASPLALALAPDLVKKESKAKARPPAVFVTIPRVLDSAPFRTAWEEWKEHRRERRSPLTPATEQKQLKTLEAAGEVRAVAMIEKSITMGWLGLFPEKPPKAAVVDGVQRKPKPETPIVIDPETQALLDARREADRQRRVKALSD